jgi:phospholipid/cholesterol/gamma-HCH transport system permease protein
LSESAQRRGADPAAILNQLTRVRAWAPGVLSHPWRWLLGWWFALFVGAQLAVLAFSPSSYRRGSVARGLLQVHEAAGRSLLGFTLLMALFNLVVIHILVVTANAYGLAAFALDAVVRVLVLELIPLAAPLYVAVNYSIPAGSELRRARQGGAFARLTAQGLDPLSREVLPRVLGGLSAVVLLAAVSCVISLLLAYFSIYGFTWAAVAPYSHAVGQIFGPTVTLIFCLKTILFALTAILLPLVHGLGADATRTHFEVRGLVQMLALMLLIEILSLVGNYY